MTSFFTGESRLRFDIYCPRIKDSGNNVLESRVKKAFKYIPSYGRRGGRTIRKGRRRLLDELLPKLEIVLPDEYKARGLAPLRRACLAPLERNYKKFYLEIGFGGGEHLAYLAEENPDSLFIGSEVYEHGITKLLSEIESNNLENIRIFNEDARLLLEAMPDDFLDGIYILFPDPWPKRKHHKRRLINQETIKTLARILKPGGNLRIATDHAGYLEWILVHMDHAGSFTWQAGKSSDWKTPPSDHFTTRYEKKEKAGKPAWLDFIKA